MTHAITTLTLENFRNYRSLSLTVDAAPVVLRGLNGAGKTNILESISLLAPGRGLRGGTLREMDRIVVGHESLVVSEKEMPQLATHDPGLTTFPWVVAARVTSKGETTLIGTGRDPEVRGERRIIKINGEKLRGQAGLAAHTCIQWLTPATDQIFTEGGTVRRKFFDRLVYGFLPEHAARVSAYEAVMRERNRLLSTFGVADPHWLSVLEVQMAGHAVAITLARQEVLARMQAELADDIAHFPRAALHLEGDSESLLNEGRCALEVEALLAARLESSRREDARKARTGIGPHRSVWNVVHSLKQMPAEQCSTGEQKALLLSIILAAARARAAWCGVPPILLLDEVVSHLDAQRRRSLFELIHACRIQAWMTGTDAADFKGLEGGATLLTVADGCVNT